MEPARPVVVQGAVREGVDDAAQPRHVLVVPAGVVGAPQLGQLVLGGAEDVGVVRADGVEDLDVRAVQGPQGERPVHHELHIGRARGLLPGRGDLLGDVRGGDDVLGRGDVVVVDEDHLDAAVDVRVGVHHVGDRVDELDDGLGARVPGGRLRAEDEHAARRVQLLALFEAEVQVQHVEGVEQLALVLVEALDLDVENGVGVDLDPLALPHPRGEVDLVGALDLGEALQHRVRVGVGEVPQDRQIAHPGVGTGDLVEQGGQAGVALLEPPARSDAVGLVVEALGPDGVPFLEGLALDDLRVQRGNAVDGVRGVAGDPRHPHGVAGHGGHVVDGALVQTALGHVATETAVDLAHDLGDAREEPVEDVDVPRLQRLGQDRVVRVREGAGDDLPGVLPAEVVVVHEQAHELGDGQHGVRVVELHRVVLGEAGEVVAVVPHVVVDDLLQGRGAEEVLLAHAQHLALEGGVVGVQDAGDVHRALAVDDGVGEALGVEGVVVELLEGLGLPQAQGPDVLRAVPGDRHVVGDGAHSEVGVGDDALELLAPDDEGVALLHPRVGVLGLEAVVKELLEQAVAVEDAVARHGQVQRGAGVQEAGGEASEAAVAQSRVGLLLEDGGQVDALRGEGVPGLVDQAQVGQVVEQRAPHEELRGEVVLLAPRCVLLGRRVPAVGDLGDDGRREPLPHLHGRRTGDWAARSGPHLGREGLGQIQSHMRSFGFSIRAVPTQPSATTFTKSLAAIARKPAGEGASGICPTSWTGRARPAGRRLRGADPLRGHRPTGPAPPVGASARARRPALNSVPHGGGRGVRPGAQDTPLS